MTQPKVGERAIITGHGYRTPATWVDGCGTGSHSIPLHWCYDKPDPRGATWSSHPGVNREPIRKWQPGDVVDHPERGRGHIREAWLGEPWVHFWEAQVTPVRLSDVADELTLVLAAPGSVQPSPESVTITLGSGFLAGWHALIAALEAAKESTAGPRPFASLIEQIKAQLPPKPDEPTRLGAVGRDSNDRLWVRAGGVEEPWYCAALREWADWDDIDVVEVLDATE